MAPDPTTAVNISRRLTEQARALGPKAAVICLARGGAKAARKERTVSFEQLEQSVDQLCHGLAALGVQRGWRVVLMVKPGIEFFAYTFALLKMGAMPVLIDPGMGKNRMAQCLSEIGADAFVGIPLAQVFRLLHREAFAGCKLIVTVGPRWGWGGYSHGDVMKRGEGQGPYTPANTTADDEAAILFTTGSTGPPKGVVYTHGTFDSQVRYLESAYGYSPDEIDVPTFPLFALFDAALGMTAVIPKMDFTRPGRVAPPIIFDAVQRFGATHMFGSPALLDRVATFGIAHGIRLPTLRRVMTAGAPVRPVILERFRQLLSSEADIFTPYGATEALPVASIESREILSECRQRTDAGAGTCVGMPMTGLDVRVIKISDHAVDTWHDDLLVDTGKIGEICVRGPNATRRYWNLEGATRAAKIALPGADPDFFHRMGDVGYFDDIGRLWFCGRKAHRVETPTGPLFTIPVEALFNTIDGVRRTALVGVKRADGNMAPVLCVELLPGYRWKAVLSALHAKSAADSACGGIEHFLHHKGFPVDIRHNAKIFREKLAVWAAGKLAGIL